MIEADGRETVHSSLPVELRGELMDYVRACALEWLREVIAKAMEGKRCRSQD